MKKIQLTQNQVALVDNEDYERLNQHKWFAHKGGNAFYAERHSQMINGKRHIIKMHHEVIGYPPKGLMTDHRNGDGLRNLRSNLRFVTKRQNHQNLKNIKKKTSKYPGVHWHKQSKRWSAQITINKKQTTLGRFTDELKAFEAYKQAVNELGETVLAV